MEEEDRMKILRKAIGERLDSVRGAMTDAEFAELVNDVAINARKDEVRIMKWGEGN